MFNPAKTETALRAQGVENVSMDADDMAALPEIMAGLDDLEHGRITPVDAVCDRLTDTYRAMPPKA